MNWNLARGKILHCIAMYCIYGQAIIAEKCVAEQCDVVNIYCWQCDLNYRRSSVICT